MTVRVRDDASGRLANAATIDSPDDDGPVTVTHDGPQITDRSVLAPVDPPGLVRNPTTPGVFLPRTGGDLPLAAVTAMTVVGLLGLAVRRRLGVIG